MKERKKNSDKKKIAREKSYKKKLVRERVRMGETEGGLKVV